MNKKDIVHRVNEWADWIVRVQSSQLGYPSQTVEAKMMVYAGRVDSRPAGSIVPDMDMPRHVVAIDRVIRHMPSQMKSILKEHHLGPGNTMDKVRVYCEFNDIKQSAYRKILDDAYSFINGGLAMTYRSCG